MKKKIAHRIVNAIENGYASYPLHTMRAATLAVGRPILFHIHNCEVIYHPKGVHGEFFRVTDFNRRDNVTFISSTEPAMEAYSITRCYVRSLDTNPGEFLVNPEGGSDINFVANEVVKLAARLNTVLQFTFNEVLVVVRPNSTGEGVYQTWLEETDRRAEAYEARQRANATPKE